MLSKCWNCSVKLFSAYLHQKPSIKPTKDSGIVSATRVTPIIYRGRFTDDETYDVAY